MVHRSSIIAKRYQRNTLVHNNAVLRTLMPLHDVYYNYLGLCHKYLIKDPFSSVTSIKRATWATFACIVYLS